MKSNEKWILDQYNLCKRFFLQNSINGHYQDFLHPIFDKFPHIKAMRGRTNKKPKKEEEYNADVHRVSTFTNFLDENGGGYIDNSKVYTNQMRVSEQGERPQPLSAGNAQIVKCDINAFLKAIEEIEKRIRMEQILLNGKEDNQQKRGHAAEMDRSVRHQFSMLNFKRNYSAIKYAQEHPSNHREL